jgi:hypothetical protein
MRPMIAGFFFALSLGACAPSPEQACDDVADAFAKSVSRCGPTYDAAKASFIVAAVQGDCANTVAIRDAKSLYDTCIPFLDRLTCVDIKAPTFSLPSTCSAQLEHR